MKWSLPGYVLGPGARSSHTSALKEDPPPLSPAHAVRSKKYRDLLSKLEGPAPSAIITIQRTGPAGADAAAASGPPATPQRVLGHVSKPIGKPAPAATEGDEEGSVSDMSDDWETEDDASEVGEGAQQPEDWEEWNVCQSLFDGHVSASLEENLKYMYLNFGFYFPDTEFLVDPEGLMRYLVGCLREGGESALGFDYVWQRRLPVPRQGLVLEIACHTRSIQGLMPIPESLLAHAGCQAAVWRGSAVQVWGGSGGQAVQVPACRAGESAGEGGQGGCIVMGVVVAVALRTRFDRVWGHPRCPGFCPTLALMRWARPCPELP